MRVDESSVSVVPPLVLVTDGAGFIEVSNVLYVILDEFRLICHSSSVICPHFISVHMYICTYVLLQVLPCSVCTFNIDYSLNICYI